MNQIFFNNGDNRRLTEEIIRQIQEARTWIKACNLLFDDKNIRTALLGALSRGVALFILSNLDGVTGEVYTNKTSGKKKHAHQSTQNLLHTNSLKALYDKGAHISGLDGLHAKFILTDNGCGLVTSLNFTPNSVGDITEIGIEVSDKEYEELETIFDNLFLRPDQYKFSSNDSHFTYESPAETIDIDSLSRLTHIKMTLAPTQRGKGDALAVCNIHDLRDEIFGIINSSEPNEDLYIATYSFDPLATDVTGETLESALLNAKERGVKIHFVMRKDKAKSVKGIRFNLHNDIHAKAVTTSHRGILFTGNLTTESFESGFDLGVNLTTEQIHEVINFIKKLTEQSRK